MLTVRTTPLRTSPARTAPIRTSPFDRSFDRAFDQLVGSFFDTRRAAGPVLDASWQGDTYVLTVDLPGVPASNVAVEVAGTALTISATSGADDQADRSEWRRSLRLGGRLDPEKVEASHVDGRLTVRIGTVAPVARRVDVATVPLPQLDTPAEPTAIDAASIDTASTDTGEQPAS